MAEPVEWVAIVSMIAMAVGSGVNAYSTYQQGKAQEAAGERQAQELERQAKIADEQAEIAQLQGEREVEKRSRALAAEIGSIRANYAGNGLLVDAGEGDTIGKIEKSAAIEGFGDIATLEANKKMNVWGFQEQANSLRFNANEARIGGKNARRAGNLSAVGTALGGIGQVGASGATYYSTGDNWQKSMFNTSKS